MGRKSNNRKNQGGDRRGQRLSHLLREHHHMSPDQVRSQKLHCFSSLPIKRQLAKGCSLLPSTWISFAKKTSESIWRHLPCKNETKKWEGSPRKAALPALSTCLSLAESALHFSRCFWFPLTSPDFWQMKPNVQNIETHCGAQLRNICF